MAIVTINGVDLPAPTSLIVSKQDLDSPDTTRNEQGVLQRYRIRKDVYKIELQFNVKKGNEIQIIESALGDSKLTVTFPDTTGRITKQMYVSDRSKEIILYNNGVTDQMRWSLDFSLVEY